MKKNLITLISIILVLILVLSPINVNAALEDISVTLTSDTNRVKEGDEVTLEFTVTDKNKINGFEADINDTDIFKVSSVKIDQAEEIFNDWSTTKNKLQVTGKVASETLKVIIKLKVQSTPKSKVTFTIDNIQVNEDNTNWTEESIKFGSKSIEFEGPETENNEPSNPSDGSGDQDASGGNSNKPSTNPSVKDPNKDRETDDPITIGGTSSTNNNSGSTTNSGSSSNSSNNSSSQNANTATTSIPQTGEHDILLIGLISTTMMAIATYVGYRKYKCI